MRDFEESGNKEGMSSKGTGIISLFCVMGALAAESAERPLTNAPAATAQVLEAPPLSLWQDGVGAGFRPTVQDLAVEVGAGPGFVAFGSHEGHALALMSLSYGHMWGPVKGEGHWYRGNWEYRTELFGGAEFSPDEEWILGLTPHLRYNLATGTRWVPFIDGGAGVTATGIGPPDLSNTFEFNLQATLGTHYFLRDNLALTAEARYVHMSCAGISHPNFGLNTVLGMVGVTWFF